MAKRTHDNGVDRDMTPEEESASNALIAKWKTEDDAKDAVEAQRAEEKLAKENTKASAKAKLMAGEALTEDEANTIVL